MRGHIARKGRRYYVVVDEGKSDEGKRRQRWHGGFDTRKEAERGLVKILSGLEEGTYVPPNRMTLGGFLSDEWLPAVRGKLRAGTFVQYETQVRAYVVPYLGSTPLQRLNPGALNAFYATITKDRDLSPKSVRNVHGLIRRALSDAVRWGHIQRNVADLADPPKDRPTEMRTWTAEELRTFLDAVHGERLYAAFLVAATTGIRRGELLGLKWADLDPAGGRLAIRRSLTVVKAQPVLGETKTARGRRSVPLPPRTQTALREFRRQQLEERLAFGPAYQDEGFVFTREDGKPVHPKRLSEAFDRWTRSLPVRRIRFHDLRHSFATLALEAGVNPKVVSEILGHANIGITLDTYSHAVPAMQEEATTRVADLVFGVES